MSWLVNIFKGFYMDSAAASTFSNVSQRLRGKSSPPSCIGAAKISVKTPLSTHSHIGVHH